MGELVRFRKRRKRINSSAYEEGQQEPISLEERRAERTLRKHYESLLSMEEQTREDGHEVLGGRVFYRRVRSWGSTRKTPVTLSFIDRQLQAIRREKISTMQALQTDAKEGSEERIHSDKKYRRTRQWMEKKGYQ